ncbi:MAG: cation:proton antiporter [Chloroflexota bacterium]
MNEHLLISLSLILILGIGAQWLAGRLRLPSILLLLVLGFLAGPVTGLINTDETFGELLFPLVSLSVAVILFEGGLSLRVSELPRLRGVIGRLISVGALITWLVGAVAARYILGLDWPLSVLLGAILIVTGPTVVGPLLRQIRPKGKAAKALKWEGILIDPVGAVLAVLIFEAILGGEFGQAPSVVVLGVLQTLAIGVIAGLLGAVLIVVAFRRYWVPDHLHNPITLLVVVASFAVSNLLHPEAGLLTVTIMGLALANQNQISIRHIVEFKENLQVLLIGSLFILLASRLQLDDLLNAGWRGLLFLGVLVLIARPLSVLFSTWRSDLDVKERLFLSWMAPRGIVAASVASIFAFELVESGHAGAEQLVPMTFLVIIGTVALYGLTSGPLARALGLAERNPQGALIVGAHSFGQDVAETLGANGFRTVLIDSYDRNVWESEQRGLEAYHGDALSEALLDEINLSGIGRLLALTSNDEVNSLAALHYRDVFGRAEVYQLDISDQFADREPVTQHLRGRSLFGTDVRYENLCALAGKGARVQVTEMTEHFDYVSFQSLYGNEAMPLFLITAKGELLIYTTEYQPIPKRGQKLVSLAPPLDLAGQTATSDQKNAQVKPEPETSKQSKSED